MSNLEKLAPSKTGLNQRPLLSYNSSWDFIIITVGLYWDMQRQLHLIDLLREKLYSLQFKTVQPEAFQELKNCLVSAPVLRVYDPELPIRVQSDARPNLPLVPFQSSSMMVTGILQNTFLRD